ncbi:MAG: hypothetical protein MK105_15830 [Crocinitomicaceae bacterium]|nr:hypothetical protein [Crocinitomicaceae bacterium]
MFGRNIFYLTYLDGAEVDLVKLKEVVKNGFELHGEKPFYSIIDLRDNFASMDSDAKKYLANQKLLNNLRICEVVLVNSLAMRLVTKGYFIIFKPKWPLKVVNKNSELIDFLNFHNADEHDIRELEEYLVNVQV